MIQWFIWDPGIGVRMHFLVVSCRLLKDKPSLAREDYNVSKSDMHANPKNGMHANPKSYIRRLVEPKGIIVIIHLFGDRFGEL